MLAEMQRPVDYVFIWSDEKISTVKAVTNTQNDRLYARDAGDLPEGPYLFMPYGTSWSDGAGRSRF